jgi:hypothetical protein
MKKPINHPKPIKKMKIQITSHGDQTVGIFDRTWQIDLGKDLELEHEEKILFIKRTREAFEVFADCVTVEPVEEYYEFPDLPELLEPLMCFSLIDRLPISPLKLKVTVLIFNAIHDSESEDDKTEILDIYRRAILDMKKELGINKPIQEWYF